MYQKLLNRANKLIPRISQTERIALNSGTKSVEELFFKGIFPKKYLKENFKYPSTNDNTKLLLYSNFI